MKKLLHEGSQAATPAQDCPLQQQLPTLAGSGKHYQQRLSAVLGRFISASEIIRHLKAQGMWTLLGFKSRHERQAETFWATLEERFPDVNKLLVQLGLIQDNTKDQWAFLDKYEEIDELHDLFSTNPNPFM